MKAEKISAWVPVADEDIVDFGIGTPEQQAEAQDRIARDQRKLERYWHSLPWYIRVYRTLYYWSWRIPERLSEWRR